MKNRQPPRERLGILCITAVMAAMVAHVGINDHRRTRAVIGECAKDARAHIVTDRSYPGSPVKRCVVEISRWDDPSFGTGW